MRHTSLLTLVAVLGTAIIAFVPQFGNRAHQISARNDRQVILVAARDLQVGMKLNVQNIEKLILKKVVRRNDVPPNAILISDELIGKTVNGTYKAGVTITDSNLCNLPVCGPGPEKHLYTIKIPYECVGPWVRVGGRVNVYCSTRRSGSEGLRHINLLSELSVVAMDTSDKLNYSFACCCQIYTVTLACRLEEAHWLELAQVAKAQLRFLVIDERSEPFPVPSDEERYAFFNLPLPRE